MIPVSLFKEHNLVIKGGEIKVSVSAVERTVG